MLTCPTDNVKKDNCNIHHSCNDVDDSPSGKVQYEQKEEAKSTANRFQRAQKAANDEKAGLQVSIGLASVDTELFAVTEDDKRRSR